jgi:hypothetical protein
MQEWRREGRGVDFPLLCEESSKGGEDFCASYKIRGGLG